MKTKYIILCAIGLGVYVFCFTSGVLYILKPKTIYNSHATLSSAKKTTPLSHRAARIHYGNSIDTLGSNDTIYFYPEKSYKRGSLELEVVADSLNGSTTGSLTIQTSKLGLIWNDEIKIPINGTSPSEAAFEWPYDYLKTKVRVVAISPTATQQTKISFQIASN